MELKAIKECACGLDPPKENIARVVPDLGDKQDKLVDTPEESEETTATQEEEESSALDILREANRNAEFLKNFRESFKNFKEQPDSIPLPAPLPIPKPEFKPSGEPGIIDRNGVRGAGIQHILPSIGDITINANGLDAKEAKEFIGEELSKQFRRASGVI